MTSKDLILKPLVLAMNSLLDTACSISQGFCILGFLKVGHAYKEAGPFSEYEGMFASP